MYLYLGLEELYLPLVWGCIVFIAILLESFPFRCTSHCIGSVILNDIPEFAGA
jgi:hypothetical protein